MCTLLMGGWEAAPVHGRVVTIRDVLYEWLAELVSIHDRRSTFVYGLLAM